MEILKAWKTGWKVIIRLWAFLILVNICLIPFHLLGEAIDLSESSLGIKIGAYIFIVFLIIFIIPLLFYLINDRMRIIDLTSQPRTSDDKSVFREKQREKYLKELKEKKENI